MSEKPIIFSGPMVRAILEGRKTQTRRVIKPQPDFAEHPFWSFAEGHSGIGWYCWEGEYPEEGAVAYKCPYGVPGGRLWVKEAFRLYDGFYHRDDRKNGIKWRPAIFMPRWASRLTLEITDVRVERLQDILEQDAKAEGFKIIPKTTVPKTKDYTTMPYTEGFAKGWDSINGKKHPWESNPWVWAIEFKGKLNINNQV